MRLFAYSCSSADTEVYKSSTLPVKVFSKEFNCHLTKIE